MGDGQPSDGPSRAPHEGECHVLSDGARPVVEATLPAVADNIGEIARRFYQHMFAARPELLDGLFNRGNQAEGTQQVALAGSVAAFASALVKAPEQLPEQLLNRIAHKHASLGLHPDQYRIVHEHLFWRSEEERRVGKECRSRWSPYH